MADFSGRKKAFLLLTVVQTVLGTALLAWIGPGQIAAAVVLYVIASVGFEGGYVFYNAFLPEVSTPRTIGTISSLAWGVGFLGGLASLVACYPFLARPLTDASGALDVGAASSYRNSFLVVAAFLLRAMRGEPLRIDGDGSQERRFVYVEDLAAAHVLALKPEAKNRTFNLESNETTSIRQLAETVRDVVGDVEVTFGPARPGDYRARVVQSDRARDELGWEPKHTFAEGLTKTLAWYREQEAR